MDRLRPGRVVATMALALAAWSAPGQQLGGAPHPDPRAILAQAKAASGGAAWDALRTQHSRVRLAAGSLSGRAERWSEFTSGRSTIAYTIGPVAGAAGFDGKVAWTQDATGQSKAETDTARELAVNAAYRDRLAFWYPERAAARVTYKERAAADGAQFDVIRITPEGGRPFELWINTETHLIERLVEREALATRTEIYMDLRNRNGVLVPYRVRASRDGVKPDEVIVVEEMEFNVPLDRVRFAQPGPPRPDVVFPPGRVLVEVPFEWKSGHLFVNVRINGRGPVRMLFDSTGHNVLLPKVAAALGLQPEGAGAQAADPAAGLGVVRADRVELGGVTLERQVFATVDVAAFLQRVEGLDDIGGILGSEVLRRIPLKLDYEHSRLVLYDPARFRYTGRGTRLGVTLRGQAPEVRADVDGIAASFEIDTGSRGSLTLSRAFVEANGLAGKYGARVEAVHGAGVTGPLRATLARVRALDLGGIVVAEPVTALALQDAAARTDPPLAGSIGNGVLRRFGVTFDLRNAALYLEPNAHFRDFDAYDRAGLWLERGAQGYEVIDVVPTGPAAAAGLRIGDVIVAVDGRRWTAVPLSAVRDALKQAPGRKVRLRIEGGRERVVTLRDLV